MSTGPGDEQTQGERCLPFLLGCEGELGEAWKALSSHRHYRTWYSLVWDECIRRLRSPGENYD